MQKTFLKFAAFELLERAAHLSLLLDALNGEVPGGVGESMRRELTRLRESVVSDRAFFNSLFSDAALPEAEFGPARLENVLYAPYRRLGELSRLLLQIAPPRPQPEAGMFLSDVLGRQASWAILGAVEDGADAGLDAALPDARITTLSVLQWHNPLAWVTLLAAPARQRLGLDTTQWGALRERHDHPALDCLITHAIMLRLCGPAHYFQALGDATLRRDAAFLHALEPALFYGLNHFNMTHKSLVILHEALERTRDWLLDASAPVAFTPDCVRDVFNAVEQAIPSREAFDERQFEQAVRLQDRIAQGILPSASPVSPGEDIASRLEAAQAHPDEPAPPIYELLGMLREKPHTPREIINAGWLHKVERSTAWLYAILHPQADAPGLDTWLDEQDTLLKKAIETAEVQRVLLCEAP